MSCKGTAEGGGAIVLRSSDWMDFLVDQPCGGSCAWRSKSEEHTVITVTDICSCFFLMVIHKLKEQITLIPVCFGIGYS